MRASAPSARTSRAPSLASARSTACWASFSVRSSRTGIAHVLRTELGKGVLCYELGLSPACLSLSALKVAATPVKVAQCMCRSKLGQHRLMHAPQRQLGLSLNLLVMCSPCTDLYNILGVNSSEAYK